LRQFHFIVIILFLNCFNHQHVPLKWYENYDFVYKRLKYQLITFSRRCDDWFKISAILLHFFETLFTNKFVFSSFLALSDNVCSPASSNVNKIQLKSYFFFWGQFHQHFTCTFFVLKCFAQLFSVTFWLCNSMVKGYRKKSTHKMWMKLTPTKVKKKRKELHLSPNEENRMKMVFILDSLLILSSSLTFIKLWNNNT